MSELDRQHYIPKGLLKNFGTKKPNGKYEVGLIDIPSFKVEYRNTNRAMYGKKIYDTNDDDIKILEKKFNTEIEAPMLKILNRLLNDLNEVNITRREQIIIKKYMLIQIFRSLNNRESYANPPDGEKLLSDYNIKEGESKLDFWKREMLTILDADWDQLVENIDLVSVKAHAQMIHSGFLLFFKTKEEFIINDSGVVCERTPIDIPVEDTEEFLTVAKMTGESLGITGFDKMIANAQKNKKIYMDTCVWMPLSTNFAVVNVNEFFKPFLMDPLNLRKLPAQFVFSKLHGYLSLPKITYVNQKAINADAKALEQEYEPIIEKLPKEQMVSYKNTLMIKAITKNKSDDDTYNYHVNELGPQLTMEWNISVMNEVYQYLCFKTPSKMTPIIEEYNQQLADGVKGMNHNYTGYDVLVKNLEKIV